MGMRIGMHGNWEKKSDQLGDMWTDGRKKEEEE